MATLFRMYGAPRIIVRDDGPEFRSHAVQTLLARYHVTDVVIPPGQPFDNGFIESFHSRFRDECLDRHVFATMDEARHVITRWIRHYNAERPHSALNDKTP